RKSLQGLDCVSAAGAKAFDELEEVIDKLGDNYGKGFTWAKVQKEKLHLVKRYLKRDYNVGLYPQDNDCTTVDNHEHDSKCDICELLPTLFPEVRSVIGSVNCSAEEQNEMEY
ncbi:unnamed protein product, partial [Pocillopora meandrina]